MRDTPPQNAPPRDLPQRVTQGAVPRVPIQITAEAEKTALALLERFLTEEQHQTLHRFGWFVVRGSDGKRYRLWRNIAMNIDELDELDRRVATFCVHPYEVPLGDSLLAQKVHLEHDAPGLLRLANRSDRDQRWHAAGHQFPPLS